jgi:hypothetical protein
MPRRHGRRLQSLPLLMAKKELARAILVIFTQAFIRVGPVAHLHAVWRGEEAFFLTVIRDVQGL